MHCYNTCLRCVGPEKNHCSMCNSNMQLTKDGECLLIAPSEPQYRNGFNFVIITLAIVISSLIIVIFIVCLIWNYARNRQRPEKDLEKPLLPEDNRNNNAEDEDSSWNAVVIRKCLQFQLSAVNRWFFLVHCVFIKAWSTVQECLQVQYCNILFLNNGLGMTVKELMCNNQTWKIDSIYIIISISLYHIVSFCITSWQSSTTRLSEVNPCMGSIIIVVKATCSNEVPRTLLGMAWVLV